MRTAQLRNYAKHAPVRTTSCADMSSTEQSKHPPSVWSPEKLGSSDCIVVAHGKL